MGSPILHLMSLNMLFFFCRLKFVVKADDSIYARELPCLFPNVGFVSSLCYPFETVLLFTFVHHLKRCLIGETQWSRGWSGVGQGVSWVFWVRYTKEKQRGFSGEGGEKTLVLEVNYSKVWWSINCISTFFCWGDDVFACFRDIPVIVSEGVPF